MGLGCYFGNQGFLFPLFRLFTPLLLHIEAGAILGGKLIVAMNRCLGIFLLQLLYERFQRRLLLRCSGILRLTILGKAADVAYSDAYGVVALAVGTHLFYRSAHVDASITVDHEMITDAEKATTPVFNDLPITMLPYFKASGPKPGVI